MNKLSTRLIFILCAVFSSFNLFASVDSTNTDVSKDKIWNIHFKVGKSNLDLNYNGNGVALDALVSNVKELITSADFKLSRIRITGYASPEGSIPLNQKLSADRANSLKNYLKSELQLDEDSFETIAGGEYWNGLKEMVDTSNIPDKAKIIDIITTEDGDVDREVLLKRLPSKTYLMILKDFFPKLRSASTIQLVDRTEKLAIIEEPAPEPEPIPEPKVVEEPKIVFVPDTKCRCIPPVFAIKTNLAYWAAVVIPNIELEAFFAKRYSFSVEGVHRWKDFSAAKKNANIWQVSPEFRVWANNDQRFNGSYFGVYGSYGEYDVKLEKKYGRQGDFVGAGLSYGYVFKFKRWECFKFELGLAVGYARLKYDRYYWADPCNAYDTHIERNYWGPTKLKATIGWRF